MRSPFSFRNSFDSLNVDARQRNLIHKCLNAVLKIYIYFWLPQNEWVKIKCPKFDEWKEIHFSFCQHSPSKKSIFPYVQY